MRSKAKRLPAEKAGTPRGLLSVDDVCAIIRACQASSVSSLKFRGLEVDFLPRYADQRLEEELRQDLELPPPVDASPARTEAELQVMRQRLRELDAHGRGTFEKAEPVGGMENLQTAESIENEMDQLLVTDPLAYEQMMNDDQEFADAKPG